MNDGMEPGADKIEKTLKAERLADEATDAGRKLLESETGRKVADAATSAFDKVEELGRKALNSDIGKQAGAAVEEAAATGSALLKTQLGKNVAAGALIGAAIALPVPFIGPIAGALIGGAIGFARVITKKN